MTTRQRGGVTVHSIVDYIIAKSMAFGMIKNMTIEDFLPSTNSRNYHSHLMIRTQFGGSSHGSNLLNGEAHYCWVSGMESTWVEHTSTPDFVNVLAAVVGEQYNITDQLNMAVE